MGLTGLVTLLILLGLAEALVPFDAPVLDRVADIDLLLSLYTVGAARLLLPPRWPVAMAGDPADSSRSRPVGGTGPRGSVLTEAPI